MCHLLEDAERAEGSGNVLCDERQTVLPVGQGCAACREKSAGESVSSNLPQL